MAAHTNFKHDHGLTERSTVLMTVTFKGQTQSCIFSLRFDPIEFKVYMWLLYMHMGKIVQKHAFGGFGVFLWERI